LIANRQSRGVRSDAVGQSIAMLLTAPKVEIATLFARHCDENPHMPLARKLISKRQ
jgi:hypothetical protein